MIPLNIGTQRPVQKGDFLLSEPFLQDENFSRSVIYLCDHNEEGSFGFTLTDTLIVDIKSLGDHFPDVPVTIGFGGPVERGQLYFIHANKELDGAISISNNMFLGGSFSQLVASLNEGEIASESVRMFIGYTGWGPNQLNEELAQKTWIVMRPPTEETILTPSDETLWKDLIKSLGGKYAKMAEYPANPSDN